MCLARAPYPLSAAGTGRCFAPRLAAARHYFAEDNQLQHKKGGLPTISTQDGTLQIISNNDSGNEFQVAKDGTVTFVNGGLSPGIFSVRGRHSANSCVGLRAARAPVCAGAR